jgi:uncharacterized GH25 family protein
MGYKIICLIIIVLLCPLAVNAHNTIIRPLSGWADVGDVVILPIGGSDNTTSTELPEGFTNITIMSQSGAKEEHILNNKTMTDGFWKLLKFDVDKPGLYIVYGHNGEGAWTHIITNPPATDYWINDYADNINFTSINKTGWAKDWSVERSYPLHTYAKCFIAGPGSDFSTASKPIGQKIEIVPLDNITQVGKGDFQFQVMFNGKPFDNITVTAEKVGNDSKIAGVTDKDGKVKLTLHDSSSFSEWLIAVDTLKDLRVVQLKDLPHGEDSSEKSFVGPVYRAAIVLRTDYLKPS